MQMLFHQFNFYCHKKLISSFELLFLTSRNYFDHPTSIQSIIVLSVQRLFKQEIFSSMEQIQMIQQIILFISPTSIYIRITIGELSRTMP